MATEVSDVQPLEDMLTNTVATKTWTDNGGTGTISEMVVGNRVLLVLSQTQEVHEEIEDTLEMLRKAGGLKTTEPEATGTENANGELPARRGRVPNCGSEPPRIGCPRSAAWAA